MAAIANELRLERLRLQNFRGFAECTIDLHPTLTVLVAENGKGKTALLDGVGIALGLFVDVVSGMRQSHGFEKNDVRMVPAPNGANGANGAMIAQLPTRLEAEGWIDGERVRWQRSLSSTAPRSRTSMKDAKELLAVAQRLHDGIVDNPDKQPDNPPTLPAVAFYGTGRLWSEHRLTLWKSSSAAIGMGRTSGYSDCLSSSSSFKAFLTWYESLSSDVKHTPVSALRAEQRPERLIAAVRAATSTVLRPTGWGELHWDFDRKELIVEHPDHGRLPLTQLSDGVRNMVALVADLAHRCARLNPHLGEESATATPGLILIDEVDMHLHPRWQQQIVDLLCEAFPSMQFILTTHSPHVLSTVDVGSIRVLRLKDGEALFTIPTFQTRGVESADVLTEIMGVDPIPPVEQAGWIKVYRGMIEDGKAETDEARKLRLRIEEHFGAQHPVVLDCDRLIRFQAFKIRRAAAQGQAK